MADNRKYIAIKPTTLSTGVNVGSTTCIPSQIKDRLGNTISSMTSFGTKGFGVISPDTDKEEQFVFTGLSGGTVSGISAVTMQDPYTETSGWQKEHAAGEPIILYTNSPAFYNEFANTQNDNTFAGVQTFSVSPIVPTGGTGTQAANHDDIAAAVTGASGTATNLVAGTVKLSVAAASAPNPIAVGDNDPRVPTSGQTALLAAITADAAEINKLDGMTATQAQLNEAGAFFAATDITGAEAEDLTDGGETTLHSHIKKALIATRTADTAAGTQTIAHGLSVTPKYIEVRAILNGFTTNSEGPGYANSVGFSDGTNNSCIFSGPASNGAGLTGTTSAGNSSSYCINLPFDSAAATDAVQRASATFDGTNVTLTWTTTGTLSVANAIQLLIIVHT